MTVARSSFFGVGAIKILLLLKISPHFPSHLPVDFPFESALRLLEFQKYSVPIFFHRFLSARLLVLLISLNPIQGLGFRVLSPLGFRPYP